MWMAVMQQPLRLVSAEVASTDLVLLLTHAMAILPVTEM
jgi:hypothetical protein